MANVQIPEQLFVDLCRAHLDGMDSPEVMARIQAGLAAKLEAIGRRSAYGTSKTAPTAEGRETARQEYLEMAGIHPDFRW